MRATDKCTQVNLLLLGTGEISEEDRPAFSLSDLLQNKMNLFTFTGIHSVSLLDALVSCVEELAVEAKTNKKLSVRDRVILTMVKIKENMTFAALGVLFGVNAQTCANYFKNMCPMLAQVCKVMIPFPDHELVRSNLPKSFKNYKHTRIILDCAETPIEKCKCLKCRILTYSQYKKNHTVKFNVGITPSGLISEISVPYGGRASDKYIVEDSGILLKLSFKDGVMVDKGYRIEKQCEENYLDLIRPPFLKKQQADEQRRCD
ncbi:Putative transposase for insertion sequence element IS112 [Frankliniella fusca]|uniref:Transposase for insertion sequence element IS112 n=1 Tax=Frankliniella fusca TaxID=407009 RepID=A0AAE1HWX4_9NEOP|nr:Putative transposase for insertion sequence element IS112 [Frankliniella fusca]